MSGKRIVSCFYSFYYMFLGLIAIHIISAIFEKENQKNLQIGKMNRINCFNNNSRKKKKRMIMPQCWGVGCLRRVVTWFLA